MLSLNHKNVGPFPTDSHPSIAFCDEIKKISEPLKTLNNVTYFTHLRGYWHSGMFELCNNKEWMQYYWRNNLHQYAGMSYKRLMRYGLINEVTRLCKPGTTFYEKVVVPGQTQFDINHMVVLAKHHFGYSDLFLFATPAQNDDFELFFVENKHLFERFVAYYKASARQLIKTASQNLYPHPPGLNANDINEGQDITSAPYKENDKEKFLREIETRRYYLSGSYENIYLTRRELDCLYLLQLNLPYKKIASMLSISLRTVEKFISDIRNKLNCENKKALIDLVAKNDMIKFYNDIVDVDNVPRSHFNRENVAIPGVCRIIQSKPDYQVNCA